MGSEGNELPEFHPQTILRAWGNGAEFRLADAQSGVSVFGATGSGKTSGPARSLAYGYLANDFGGVVLCAKKEERIQWQKWAQDCERTEDLIIVDKAGAFRFNFIDWEASRPEEGGGLAINVVALLDEIAGAVAGPGGKEGGAANEKFWEDSLHHLNTNLVDLLILAGTKLSLPTLAAIVSSAPMNAQQAFDTQWQERSECWKALTMANEAMRDADPEVKADFKQCQNYWLNEFPVLSENTRSIIVLTFSILTRPFNTRPLRRLFSSDTNVKPEDAFNGKIIIIDLPVQEFRLAGRLANLAWKYCFQVAVLRRSPPKTGFLRPVFLWADEAQNFISKFDAEYQAVARSAAGCTVYLTQNRESYLRVLGNQAAVDSLLGNLQCKIFCQNSGDTNEWASKLLGERWVNTTSTNVGQSSSNDPNQRMTSGVTRAEQKRHYIESAMFTTLKRGGEFHQFQVEAIVYNGGKQFPGIHEKFLPYKLLTFNQK